MRYQEPDDITEARACLQTVAQTDNDAELLRAYDDGRDLLEPYVNDDSSPWHRLAVNLTAMFTNTLYARMPPAVPDIFQGLVNDQSAQWFTQQFAPEDVRKATVLLEALR